MDIGRLELAGCAKGRAKACAIESLIAGSDESALRVACLVRLGASTGRKGGNDAGLAFEICVQLCHGLVVDRSVKEDCNFSAITVVHGLVRFANLVESVAMSNEIREVEIPASHVGN